MEEEEQTPHALLALTGSLPVVVFADTEAWKWFGRQLWLLWLVQKQAWKWFGGQAKCADQRGLENLRFVCVHTRRAGLVVCGIYWGCTKLRTARP